jgi:hypothetical protein
VTDHQVNVRASAKNVSKRARLNDLTKAAKVMAHLIKHGSVTSDR